MNPGSSDNKIGLIIMLLITAVVFGYQFHQIYETQREQEQKAERLKKLAADREQRLAEQREEADRAARLQQEKIEREKERVAGTPLLDERDGQEYRQVLLGGTIWMAENLRYAGVPHASVNNDPNNDKKYGYLYNWAAARNACPAGWRLPEKSDFANLLTTTGVTETESAAIRSDFWNNGTGTGGFNALPAGYHWLNNIYADFEQSAYFWIATPTQFANSAYYLLVSPAQTKIGIIINMYGYSVRCIKAAE